MFPLSFATAMGFDPLSSYPGSAISVGSGPVTTFYWDVQLDFSGLFALPVRAGFSDGMNSVGMGLLGQMGFFDRVNVLFNHRKKQFFIEVD